MVAQSDGADARCRPRQDCLPRHLRLLELHVRPSPLLSAAAAAALLAAFAGPATAATDPVPAAGVASSTITLLDIAAGGRTVGVGQLSLLSDALGSEAVAKILATPLTVDGTAYGQRTITPADSPATVAALDSGSVAPALAGLVTVTSPVLTGKAETTESGPSSRVGAGSFGGVDVLGLPVALSGSLDAGSVVSRTGGALGDKTLEVTDLALPSIADVLAALGLDLSKLPTDVLVELLGELDLLTTAVTTADKALTDATAAIQTQIDAAQKAVDDATAALAAKTAELTAAQSQLAAAERDLATKTAALAPLQTALASAQTQLATANGTLASATTALNGALSTAGLASLDAYNALPELLKAPLRPVIDPLVAAVTAAQTTVASATAVVTKATADLAAAQSLVDVAAALVTTLKGTVATLQGLVDGLQATLDAAVAALRTVLKDVQPLIDQLLILVTAVLDGTPLVSIDGLRVVTESKVTSAAAGGQSAKVVGGEIEGLEVLGTDVLDDVLGVTKVDVLDLTGSTLTAVNGLVAELTGTLSSVLSTVPGFPALSIPAPKVEVLTKQLGTGVTGGFGTATTSVRALSVTLPSITLPQALALPSAAQLPAFGSVLSGAAARSNAVLDDAGNLVSSPVTLALGTLSEQARFRAAVAGTAAPGTGTPGTGTPGTGTPGATPGTALPTTGASQALAVLGVVLMAAAVATRRRRELVSEL